MNDQRSVLESERSGRSASCAMRAVRDRDRRARRRRGELLTDASPSPAATPQAPANRAARHSRLRHRRSPGPRHAGAAPCRPPAAAARRARRTDTGTTRGGTRRVRARPSVVRQGKYVEAKTAFDQAYAAVPNPVVLLSTAECDVRLNQLDDAYIALQKYLADRPDGARSCGGGAESRRVARHACAAGNHRSEPVGAAISIDGQPTGNVTPAEIEVKRGEHTVWLALAGYEATTEDLAARIGARHELQIALRSVAPVAAPPPGGRGQEPRRGQASRRRRCGSRASSARPGSSPGPCSASWFSPSAAITMQTRPRRRPIAASGSRCSPTWRSAWARWRWSRRACCI